jgi:hypothetical protein
LPIYHHKSKKLGNVELSKVFVILKYPCTNKYLLFDSLEVFLLQGGRYVVLRDETTTASLIAKKCFTIFTFFKRNENIVAKKAILLPKLTPVVPSPEKSAVLRYAYTDRTKNFLHPPASWTVEGKEFKDIYSSFGDWKTFAEDFSNE